jgi:hypothetical protein
MRWFGERWCSEVDEELVGRNEAKISPASVRTCNEKYLTQAISMSGHCVDQLQCGIDGTEVRSVPTGGGPKSGWCLKLNSAPSSHFHRK